MENETERGSRAVRDRTGRSPRPASIGTGTLEKKNKDLNKATKELEAKVKNLQQKTRALPKVQSRSNSRANSNSRPNSRSQSRELPNTPAGEKEEKETEKKKGSTVTSRIREREADFQKQIHERDEQLVRLKERLKILSTKLTDSKEKDLKFPKDREKHVQATLEDGNELQHIIRQVTKERLMLERHLQFANDSLQRNNGVDLNHLVFLLEDFQ